MGIAINSRRTPEGAGFLENLSTDRKWHRLSGVKGKSARFVSNHYNDLGSNPVEFTKFIWPQIANALMTGLARPVVTPVACASAGAKKGFTSGGVPLAGVGAAAGFCFGLGKGLIGTSVMATVALCGIYIGVPVLPLATLCELNSLFSLNKQELSI